MDFMSPNLLQIRTHLTFEHNSDLHYPLINSKLQTQPHEPEPTPLFLRVICRKQSLSMIIIHILIILNKQPIKDIFTNIMSSRLACYSYFICFAGTISMVVLADFLYNKFSKLSIMSRCRLTSLLIEHLFFFFMVYRLNKIQSSFSATVEWLVQLSGGMFIISTMAHIVGYFKSPNVLRELVFYQINLDPIDRVGVTLWNHFFTQIWIYSTTIFFALLIIIIIVKVKDWYEKRRRERAFLEIVITQKYNLESQQEQKSCSICLMDYQEGQNVSKSPCGHLFHPQCLSGWMQENFTCPLCRASILV